jgi:ABC-type Fe3+/spermidine/putrescine transport system ATPase subunit
MPEPKALLVFEKVVKQYDGRLVVDCLDLQVREGEILAVVGPSGAGKTTLLSMIIGETTPDTGRILLAGEEITKRMPRARPVGIVYQDYSLFPNLRVWENVAFPLEAARLRTGFQWLRSRFDSAGRANLRERAEAALARVRLFGHEEKYPNELSGGEKQRVALARAVITSPSLLCLDEPLASLDRPLRMELLNLISSLKDELGTTLIYVTHDQIEAFMISDRVALLRNGKLLQIDTPKNVYSCPQSTFAGSFFGELNCLRVAEVSAETAGFSVRTERGLQLLVSSPVEPGHTIAIRPEELRLSDEPGTEFSASVRDVRFLGHYTRVELATANEELIAYVPAERRLDDLSLGSVLVVRYDPAAWMGFASNLDPVGGSLMP